jgi:6-phosphogluconate dehydrogenase
MAKKADIGIVGLGVMGQSLALNIERNGFSVTGFDLDKEKIKIAKEKFNGKNIILKYSIEELVEILCSPKKILLMIPSGAPVDSVISDLKPNLMKNDIIIDGGNSFFMDTAKRNKELEKDGILFIGTGISGGEEGALYGPSIMPGGQFEAYRNLENILTKIAANVDGIPCCAYIGPDGSGHYVKMVHNGIEYALMQLIAEVYDLMNKVLKLEPERLAEIFSNWNEGELGSYLIEITGNILTRMDEEENKLLVDLILDEASQKGTGKWTSQNAMDLGVPIPTIDIAVEARFLSAYKKERVKASKILHGPQKEFNGEIDKFVDKIKDALYASMIVSYAQGMSLLREASREYKFNLKFADIAQIWRGGCIIRATVLEKIKESFLKNPDLPNLLIDDYFSGVLNNLQENWRSVTQKAIQLGVPSLALNSTLGYFDSYRNKRLPANLTQAQRDCFGAHTYKRVDKEGIFHTKW